MGHDGGKQVLHPAATQTASLFKSSHRASRINRQIEASLQASSMHVGLKCIKQIPNLVGGAAAASSNELHHAQPCLQYQVTLFENSLKWSWPLEMRLWYQKAMVMCLCQGNCATKGERRGQTGVKHSGIISACEHPNAYTP